jgi:hypothetical protein
MAVPVVFHVPQLSHYYLTLKIAIHINQARWPQRILKLTVLAAAQQLQFC